MFYKKKGIIDKVIPFFLFVLFFWCMIERVIVAVCMFTVTVNLLQTADNRNVERIRGKADELPGSTEAGNALHPG